MNIQSFEIDNWEESQMGILLDENENWLLVKSVAEDYYTDGFCLYNKSFIINRINGTYERFYERVMRLKNEKAEIPNGFEFSDTIGLLKWSQDKYGMFEFRDEDEEALSIGRINSVIDTALLIDFITSKGKVIKNYDYEFDINEIRAISFSSNYFDAVRLLWLDENKTKPIP